MRKIKEPRRRADSSVINWEQDQFENLYKDVPASEIPDYSLAEAVNVLCWGAWLEVRPGTRLWAASNLPSLQEEVGFSPGGAPLSPLPSLEGRSDYVASKDENVITKTVGQDFSADDVGSFFVWPEGYHDLITEFINANQVRVRNSTARSATTAADPGAVRGPINGVHWHDNSRTLLIHIDTRVFRTDYRMLTYTQVYPRSYGTPANVKSDFDSNKDMVYLFANGVNQIDTINWEMYRINDSVPWNDVTRIETKFIGTPYTPEVLTPRENTEYLYGRRYLNSMSRLDSTGFRNRGTAGVAIRKETGTNAIRPLDDYADYREVWFRDPPFPSNGYVTEVVVGGALTNVFDDFQAIVEGSFAVRITVGGVLAAARQVVVHLGSAVDFQDIARMFEEAIIAAFPDADGMPDRPPICRFVDDHFICHGGNYDTSGCALWAAGTVGTDISAMAQMDVASGTQWFYHTSYVLGTLHEPAFQIPDNQRQWTHYSIYSTRFVNDPAINDTQYIWQEDLPVAKAFTATMTRLSAIWSRLDITDGYFERMDIGSFIKFEDGTYAELGVYVNSARFDTYYDYAFNMPRQAACIGDGRLGMFSQDEDIVTRQSGDEFLATDVGMTLFWADGGYGYIIEYISGNEVRVEVAATRQSQGMTWDPVGRNYNDLITDEILQARSEVEGDGVNYFLLKQRFWTALPNYDLGVVGPLFMYTAIREGNEIFYSTMAPGLIYLGGHYDARYQRHTVKDAIMALKEFPDKIILYCARSTRKIQTNVTNQIQTKSGDIVTVISGISVVDASIGVKNKGAIHTLESGLQAMVTSEPTVRIFDGYRYSEPISRDKDGKGFIQEDIQRLQAILSTGYDRLFGFIIWGQDREETVVDFNQSYRVGIKAEQPKNWMEFDGEWPIPEIEIGSFDVFSADNKKFTIVFEANSGLPYMIASREGPAGSDINKVFVDKLGTGYDRGYEIPWSFKLKEHRGRREEDLIKHLESHVHLRPQDEDNKGADGYDANGFRNAQEVGVRLYENGNVSADAVTNNVPARGDITVDQNIDANRIQLEVFGTASELKVVRCNTDYDDQDIRGAPSQRTMQEQQYQEELSNVAFWLTRGSNPPLLDRASGVEPDGSVFDYTDGPDGDDQSGIVFAAASELTYDHNITYTDFSIMFGVSNIIGNVEIVRIGNAIVDIQVAAGVYTLRFNDGANTYEQELNWDGTGWALLKITRVGDQLMFYEDGAQLDRELLDSIEVLTGNIEFRTGNAKTLFDVRFYDDNISLDAFTYYTEDVLQREGFALLC